MILVTGATGTSVPETRYDCSLTAMSRCGP